MTIREVTELLETAGHPSPGTSRACPMCSGSMSQISIPDVKDYVTGETFQVFRCAVCGLGYTWPQPSELNRYYTPTYRRYSPFAWVLLSAFYHLRVKRWTRLLGKGSALEIGCGDGRMLQALRHQGWEVVGVERTAAAARVAVSVNQLPVFAGGLEAINPRAKFDLVLLFHSLEHVPDPLSVLTQCAQLLKPGGKLIVAVPNFQSWQARVFGGSWFHLDVPRHLTHFSPQSLRSTLKTTSLRLDSIRYTSWEHDPYGWVQSTLNRMGFRQNLLTKWLMGVDRASIGTPVGLTMLLMTLVLVVPSLAVAVGSWLARAGAVMELLATKEE